jgi:hypothetical protein
MANTAPFFRFTTYTHMKIDLMSLKRLKNADDLFLLL